MRLIDADALIEQQFKNDISYNAFCSLVKRQKTISQPNWIPVTEALPHTDDKVLCCTMTKKGVPGIVIGYYLRGEHGCSWACGMNSNVVAWMPLPEPYEGSK